MSGISAMFLRFIPFSPISISLLILINVSFHRQFQAFNLLVAGEAGWVCANAISYCKPLDDSLFKIAS